MKENPFEPLYASAGEAAPADAVMISTEVAPTEPTRDVWIGPDGTWHVALDNLGDA